MAHAAGMRIATRIAAVALVSAAFALPGVEAHVATDTPAGSTAHAAAVVAGHGAANVLAIATEVGAGGVLGPRDPGRRLPRGTIGV